MELHTPGPNKRVCAFFIDSSIIQIVNGALFIVLSFDVSWLVWAAYILLKDCVNGQSLGKKIVGTQVVDETGAVAEPFKAITRNVLMVLPIFPFIEYIVMLRDKEQGRRLGDKMAKTRVNDLKPAVSDGTFLWISVGLAFFIFFIQVGLALYIMSKHPEMMKTGST